MQEIFDEAVTGSSTVQKYELGTLRFQDSKVYRYVKVIDTASANGYGLVVASPTDVNVVSADRSGGSSINSLPRGVGVGAIAMNSYGWVLVDGYHSSVLSDGSVAAGDGLIAHASTDGGVDSAATGSTVAIDQYKIFGIATAADTTSRVTALIRCL